MPDEVWNALWLSLGFLGLFAGAEFLHHAMRVPSEWSRKFLHISGGALSLTMPRLFGHPAYVLVLAAAFLLLLWGSRRLGLLQSVHRVDRNSEGSVLFPIPIFLCFWLAWYRADWVLFSLPVLVLTLADPAAFIAGRRWHWRPYRVGSSSEKTLGGSLAFAVVTWGLGVCFLSEKIGQPLLLAAVATWVEARSGRGWDNLTVPLAVAALAAALRACHLLTIVDF